MFSLECFAEFCDLWENVVKMYIAATVERLLRDLLSPSASGPRVFS